MSFVWQSDEGRLKSPEQCAREILEVTRSMDLDDFAAVLVLMCIAQESDFWCPANQNDESSFDFDHDSESDDGRSVAYLQQQNSQPGKDFSDWWGNMACRMDLKCSVRMFLERLTDNYMAAVANPALAGQFVQNVQRSAFPDAYTQHWSRAWQLLDAAKGQVSDGGSGVGFSGDPVWLEEVLREALGDRLVVEEGWEDRGVGGTMGDIWGVIVHHTANQNETPERIINGREDLAGPLAQLLIKMDGTVHLCAIGPCNHGGIGSYPGLGTNNANERTIGIECCYPTMGPGGSFDPHEEWKPEQVISLRDCVAAILKKLGYRGDRVIGHKDYANRPPNIKIDPSNMDVVGWLSGEVNKDIDGFQFPGEDHPPIVNPPAPSPVTPPSGADAIQYYASCAYWEQLGWRTQTEALAVILDAVTGEKNAGKTGMSLTRPEKPKATPAKKPAKKAAKKT